jgi:hypothetical protein
VLREYLDLPEVQQPGNGENYVNRIFVICRLHLISLYFLNEEGCDRVGHAETLDVDGIIIFCLEMNV